MTESVFNRDIYNRVCTGNGSAASTFKISEQIPVLAFATLGEIRSFFDKVNQRIAYVTNEMVTTSPQEEFDQQQELFALKAVSDLRPYLKSLHSVRLKGEFKKQIRATLQTIPYHQDKLKRLFQYYYAGYWLDNFRMLKENNQIDFGPELDELNKKLILPQKLRSIFIKYVTAIEDGVTSNEVAEFQTFQNSSKVLPLEKKVVGSGSSGKVFACGPYALKLGSESRREDVKLEFINYSGLITELTHQEVLAFPVLMSGYGEYTPTSKVSHPDIRYNQAPSTLYSRLVDPKGLTIEEKEQIALEFIHFLTHLHQLDFLQLHLSPEQLLYKKVGNRFEVSLLDNGSLIHYTQWQPYESDIFTLVMQLKVTALREEIQSGNLTAVEMQDRIRQMQMLVKKINKYNLATLLYGFFTGNFQRQGPLLENEVSTLGCSDRLTALMSRMLTFQEIEAQPPMELTFTQSGRLSGFFTELYKGNLAHCSSKIGAINNKQKSKIAHNLLSQLSILTDHQYLHCDLRSENMLYDHREEQYRATLIDFCRLVNFKKMRETLDPIALNHFYLSVLHWTPNDLPSGEFTSLIEKIRYLQTHGSTLSPDRLRECLDVVYQDIVQMEKFVIGAVLWELFNGKPPYLRTPYYKIPRFPNYPDRSYLSFVISDEQYNKAKNGVSKRFSPQISSLLLGLIHPKPGQRLTQHAIKSFLESTIS